MPTAIAQTALQPLFKLTQDNTRLLTEFWTSPDVVAQLTAGATQWLQQASQTTMRLMSTPAFANLSQGLLQNNLAFVVECSQSAVALVQQRQLEMVEQAQASAAAALAPRPGRRGA